MRRTVTCLPILTIWLISPIVVRTQQDNNDFKVFWEKFKTAVSRIDKNTVASLSRFPLEMSYGIRSIKSKAELTRRYREVFNKQTDAARCFARKEPEKDESNPRKFSIACPDAADNDVVIFHFEQGRGGWRFIGMDNLNE